MDRAMDGYSAARGGKNHVSMSQNAWPGAREEQYSVAKENDVGVGESQCAHAWLAAIESRSVAKARMQHGKEA